MHPHKVSSLIPKGIKATPSLSPYSKLPVNN